MNHSGKPCAGNLHARFDEGEGTHAMQGMRLLRHERETGIRN